MITWVLYLCIGVVVGGMAGFYFAKLDDFSKKQKQELEEKLQKSEQELVQYKDQVTAHFIETANLINNMTESYQKVHEHLANGSVELCNNAVEVNKLTISSSPLLSSTVKDKQNIEEEVTRLADSEAPKNFTNNNKNNTDNAEALTDASAKGSTAADQKNSETELKSPEPVAPSKANTNNETLEAMVPETMASESVASESVASESVASESVASETTVTETMAVAEEEESDAESKEKSRKKSRLPGSRMVH